MKINEFADKLGASILTGTAGIEREIEGLYTCDLLSWVMSHAERGDAWATVHTNLNIVAVAQLIEISCIIIPEGIKVEAATIDRAVLEGIPILSTMLNAFEICCAAFKLGLIKNEIRS